VNGFRISGETGKSSSYRESARAIEAPSKMPSLDSSPAGLQGRLHHDLRGAGADDGGPHRAGSQHVPAGNAGAFRLQPLLDMGHHGNLQLRAFPRRPR